MFKIIKLSTDNDSKISGKKLLLYNFFNYGRNKHKFHDGYRLFVNAHILIHDKILISYYI